MRYYHYHRLPSQLLTAVNGQNHSNNPLILLKRLFHFAQSLTTQEVATALRPFIFIVHPDRFWAYPKERVTNEVSLKRLNEFLDDRLNASKAPLQTRKPEETVTFYLNSTTTTNKNEASKASAADTSAAADKHDDKLSLKKVEIKLSSRENLNTTVHRILSQCSLPTDYLKKIGKQPDPNRPQSSSSSSSFSSSDPLDTSPFFRKANEFFYSKDLFEQMEAQLAKSRLESNLLNYLKTHYMEALKKLEASRPIEADLARLKAELVEALQLTDLSWTGLDWGVSHIRGALKNLAILGGQYPAEMGRLAGKRLVFSRESGIATDGAVVLSIEDVRSGWLDLIRSSPVFDPFVAALPDAERELSEQLRGISILPASEAHGDGNIKLAKRYVTQLRRFTKTMRAYAQESATSSSADPFPAHWPPSLAEYRLVVEADSGPLMLSTGGHFIVPASCPASLFVRFLSENLHRASRRSVERQAEARRTARERAAVEEVRSVFGLLGLDKDENILGEQMIDFCERLLSEAEHLRPYLRGLHIRVSMYYCVLADGQICVPFNFIPRT